MRNEGALDGSEHLLHMQHVLCMEAQKGLLPLSWNVVLPDDDYETKRVVLQPIKELANEQWTLHMKLWEHLDRSELECWALSLGRLKCRSTKLDLMMDMQQCYWEWKMLQERARHYGMVVCHTFFSKLSSRKFLLPEEAGGVPAAVAAVVDLARSWKWQQL
jgi:hypothetical protein